MASAKSLSLSSSSSPLLEEDQKMGFESEFGELDAGERKLGSDEEMPSGIPIPMMKGGKRKCSEAGGGEAEGTHNKDGGSEVKEVSRGVLAVAAGRGGSDEVVNGGLCWGVATRIGGRRYMEDKVVVLPYFMSIPCNKFSGCLSPGIHARKQSQVYYFAVFDGHGGSQLSKYCADTLHNLVGQEWESKSENDADRWNRKWEHVLSGAFAKADDALKDGRLGPLIVGSTALVVMVSACHIIAFNCGDCRAVVCQTDKVISLTKDHKPTRVDKVERITSGGGQIICYQGERVDGVLAVTRSVGDHYLKKWVTSEPKITCIPRHAEDECLVLASKGLWDKLSTLEVGQMVHTRIKKLRQATVKRGTSVLTRYVADCLLHAARKRGSGDNISIIVVDLASQVG